MCFLYSLNRGAAVCFIGMAGSSMLCIGSNKQYLENQHCPGNNTACAHKVLHARLLEP